jgi:hypothetical protein
MSKKEELDQMDHQTLVNRAARIGTGSRPVRVAGADAANRAELDKWSDKHLREFLLRNEA